MLGRLQVLGDLVILDPNTRLREEVIDCVRRVIEGHAWEEVRVAAYNLSQAHISVDSRLMLLQSVMDSVELTRNSKPRNARGMGLMNLGATCYINAVLQQLNQIEPFRRGIIATEGAAEFTDFFFQLQRLFYEFKFGQRSYGVPDDFCLNYTDHAGQPVNTK